jgi:hypothetical protein
MVNAVAAPGDLTGDGAPDWVAGSEIGYAEAFSGSGPVSLRPGRRTAATPLFGRPGTGAAYVGRGRAHPRSGTRAIGDGAPGAH